MRRSDDKQSIVRRALLLFALILLVVFVFRESGLWEAPERLRDYGAGWGTAALIVLIMASAWAFALPASAFLLITPLLFSPSVSTVITTTGCAVGAGVGYMIARYVGGWRVERFRDGRWMRFLTRHSSFFVMFGLRLVPGSPHGIVNYAAGLAAVPFARFLISTCFAMAIKSYVYAAAVHGAAEAATFGETLDSKTLAALFALALLSIAGHLLRNRFKVLAKPPLTSGGRAI